MQADGGKAMVTYSLDQLKDHVGKVLGESSFYTITQAQVNCFADATGDHNWIHVDPERAKQSPFGTTIAHGYLTLSLVPMLLDKSVTVTGTRMRVNYGINRVRFPAPVPVGARISLTVKLNSLKEFDQGLDVHYGFEITTENATRPSATGEVIYRHYRDEPGIASSTDSRVL
jgi:acyl dehydratase